MPLAHHPGQVYSKLAICFVNKLVIHDTTVIVVIPFKNRKDTALLDTSFTKDFLTPFQNVSNNKLIRLLKEIERKTLEGVGMGIEKAIQSGALNADYVIEGEYEISKYNITLKAKAFDVKGQIDRCDAIETLEKPILMLVTIDKNEEMLRAYRDFIRNLLAELLSKSPLYNAYSKKGASGELTEYRRGEKKEDYIDSLIAEIGKLETSDYICITEVSLFPKTKKYLLTAEIVDVQKSKVIGPFTAIIKTNIHSLTKGCKILAAKLLEIMPQPDIISTWPVGTWLHIGSDKEFTLHEKNNGEIKENNEAINPNLKWTVKGNCLEIVVEIKTPDEMYNSWWYNNRKDNISIKEAEDILKYCSPNPCLDIYKFESIIKPETLSGIIIFTNINGTEERRPYEIEYK